MKRKKKKKQEDMMWAIVAAGSAITAGLATLLSQRGAAAGWEKVTGDPPIRKLKRG